MSVWDWLINPAGLTPHGFCLSWAPGLVGLHAISDAVVGVAYFSIPLALAAFTAQRRDLKYGWVVYLFIAFILACGTTHLFSVVTLWVPAYGFEGLVKLLTAVLSIATALILWPLVPKLVALPSPAQLERLNRDLHATVSDQEQTAALLRVSEAKVRTANAELERRVALKTAELRAANAQLTEALAEREAALRTTAQREQEFRASFEASAVGKAQVDPYEARIVRANAAFAAMLGYTSEEMAGRKVWDFTWPEDRAADQVAYQQLLSGETPAYIREKRYLRRDGQPVWGRISGTLVLSVETGEPILMVAVIENIDARHKAEVALRAAMDELEVLIDEKTAALDQRDMLLREVYHRVKNNLQIVDGLLVLQARALSDPDAKAALRGLRSRLFALGLVHNQLMHSANLKTFNIEPFLRELTENLVGGVGDGISISIDAISLQTGLDFAIPLGLTITELVTNCLKHAFPGGVGLITINLQHSADGQIRLVIRDNGPGWPAAGSTAANSGLGTSIIEGLVAQLGGTITLSNQNGARAEILVPAPTL